MTKPSPALRLVWREQEQSASRDESAASLSICLRQDLPAPQDTPGIDPRFRNTILDPNRYGEIGW